jgi:hypothetical protein
MRNAFPFWLSSRLDLHSPAAHLFVLMVRGEIYAWLDTGRSAEERGCAEGRLSMRSTSSVEVSQKPTPPILIELSLPARLMRYSFILLQRQRRSSSSSLKYSTSHPFPDDNRQVRDTHVGACIKQKI